MPKQGNGRKIRSGKRDCQVASQVIDARLRSTRPREEIKYETHVN